MLLPLFAVSALIHVSASEPVEILDRHCTKAGVLPHPHDCSQFIICAEDNDELFLVKTVSCPKGYGFSTKEQTCVRNDQCQPLTKRTVRATPPASRKCDTSGTYCGDCKHLLVCSNIEGRGLVALANVTCPDLRPNMSCSKASCNTNEDMETCEVSDTAGNFRCLREGMFPDPTDCKRFYVCDEKLEHFAGDCDDQYNAEKQSCTGLDPEQQDKTKPAATQEKPPACTPLDKALCTGNNIAPKAIPSSPSYYTVCIPTSATKYKLTVLNCSRPAVFNEKTKVCEFVCPGKPGRFQDPDSCKSYIECGTDSTSAGTKKACPDDYAYHSEKRACLPESMVPNCRKPTEKTTTTLPTTTALSATTTLSATTMAPAFTGPPASTTSHVAMFCWLLWFFC